jgi:hypothetical protein
MRDVVIRCLLTVIFGKNLAFYGFLYEGVLPTELNKN